MGGGGGHGGAGLKDINDPHRFDFTLSIRYNRAD